jgi:hypothetical protein
MSKKINQITTSDNLILSNANYKFTIQEDGYVKVKLKNSINASVYWFPFDTCKIEYEQTKILKRPDGSLISEPERGTKVWVLKTGFLSENKDEGYFSTLEYYRSLDHKIYLQQGYIFEQEDKDPSEKKADMLTKQLEIQYEIDRLNAKEGWVAKFDNNYPANNVYYFMIEDGVVDYCHPKLQSNQNLVSKKSAETILAKYTQDELKQYLGIITNNN